MSDRLLAYEQLQRYDSKIKEHIATKISLTEKGAASGVAELDSNGKVPSSQLPSYVDDVVEGYYRTSDGKFYEESTYETEIEGETGKIYVSLDTNLPYRWTGSTFTEIPWGLALGETSSTAYRGDRGKTAYDHATNKGDEFSSDLYKITTNSDGHVTAATSVLKSTVPSVFVAKNSYSVNNQYAVEYDRDGYLSVNIPTSGFTVASNAGAHNSIYRGASLGTEVTSAQWNEILQGTFTDMFIGDYWIINGTKYVIAAFDYYDYSYNKIHNISIVTSEKMYSARMHSSDDTSRGFAKSEMYTTNLDDALSTIKYDFGQNHIYEHVAVYTDVSSGNVAKPQATEIELMDEIMVYGRRLYSVLGGIDDKNDWRLQTYPFGRGQLPLFRLNPISIKSEGQVYWLRDIVDDVSYVRVSGDRAWWAKATTSLGVRPYFLICAEQ